MDTNAKIFYALMIILNVGSCALSRAHACPAKNATYETYQAYVKAETKPNGACDPKHDQYFKGSACMVESVDKYVEYSVDFCIGNKFKLIDLD